MISAYEDWYIRKNWYALLIAICSNKGIGQSLTAMGVAEKSKPTQIKPRKPQQKYSDEQMQRAMDLRYIDGMKWHDIAEVTGINYGSLMSIYSRKKKQGLTLVDRKGGKR